MLQVVVLEILKLFATLIRMKCHTPSLDRAHLKSSLKLVIPSAIYAVNNNIYLGEMKIMELNYIFLIFTHSGADSGAASHLGNPLLCPHSHHHRPL